MARPHSTFRALIMAILVAGLAAPSSVLAAPYVIEISVDGLGSVWLQPLLDANQVPNLKRFVTEGATTMNARDDYDVTVTLPNHVTLVTGRGVYGIGGNGHMWTSNSDPSNTTTAPTYSIQNNKGSYVASVFDVAHDNGLKTGMYATKTKFSLFDHSYNNSNGRVDPIPPDDGRNKIDRYDYNASSSTVTSDFVSDMNAVSSRRNYSFLHFSDPDIAGHASGWGSTGYNDSVIAVDGYLGSIFNLVATNPALAGQTDIILTADHGGYGTNHGDATDYRVYEIPFFVWGPDAAPGTDLYALNAMTRLDPGFGSSGTRPTYSASVQPIRNGDGANLALDLLGLGPIPGSTINFSQDLVVPEPSAIVLALIGLAGLVAHACRRRMATV